MSVRPRVCAPRFVVSSWTACSASCGSGTRQRYVTCRVRLVYMQGGIVAVADNECRGGRASLVPTRVKERGGLIEEKRKREKERERERERERDW